MTCTLIFIVINIQDLMASEAYFEVKFEVIVSYITHNVVIVVTM